MGYTIPGISALERAQLERLMQGLIATQMESDSSDSSEDDDEMPDLSSDSSSEDSYDGSSDEDLAFVDSLLETEE